MYWYLFQPTFDVDGGRISIKLKMEMGNVSKRQQPDHRTAEGHNRSSM